MSRDWRAADVHAMNGERVQFAHVARHLYQESERWEQVVPDLGDARGRAWEAGCAPAVLEARHPDCYMVSDGCRAHVLRDHDQLLAPAYGQELRSAEVAGRLGQLNDRARCWAFVGDRGVFVVVREVGALHRPEVKTAYRVVPPRGDLRRPEDFLKAAVRKLRDKSSWNGRGT
jgi:hypothetical protein